MARARKSVFEEEADRLHKKCLKVSEESLLILRAYPNGGMPLEAWERYTELVIEQGELIRMYHEFSDELTRMGAF